MLLLLLLDEWIDSTAHISTHISAHVSAHVSTHIATHIVICTSAHVGIHHLGIVILSLDLVAQLVLDIRPLSGDLVGVDQHGHFCLAIA